MDRPFLRRLFVRIPVPLVLICFAFCREVGAVSPPPDGGYPGGNTAEGTSALFSLSGGIDNTALGFQALYYNTNGNYNTAEGFRALFRNSTGSQNTASGVNALFNNSGGSQNTASGVNALFNNTTGGQNLASGANALFSNTTGLYNTATGVYALYRNSTGRSNTATGLYALYGNTNGIQNTATGVQALVSNTNGNENSATGYQALFLNTTGGRNSAAGYQALRSNKQGGANTASGYQALYTNTTGSHNSAVGYLALHGNTGVWNIGIGAYGGSALTSGDHNIAVGSEGVPGDAYTIRLGNLQTAVYIAGIAGQTVGAGGTTCYVDNNGKLGVNLSARRFKMDIADMADASETVLLLRPVTFRYKAELNQEETPQFGLVAEEVERVNPDLVVRDAKGELSTVRYEAINAMLLNEFLKEHRKVEELAFVVAKQEATIASQQKAFQSAIAQQEKKIQTLTASLKAQAAQIRKVGAQLQTGDAGQKTVLNNR